MSIIIDGTEIPMTGDNIQIDSQDIDKVIYDGIAVWEKQKDIILTPGNTGSLTITGNPWSYKFGTNWQPDNNETMDPIHGRTYYISVKNANLQNFKHIRVHIKGWTEVTVSNIGELLVTVKAGSASTSRILAHLNYVWDPNATVASQQITESAILDLNVESLQTTENVVITIQVAHYKNAQGQGYYYGSYTISKIELLS